MATTTRRNWDSDNDNQIDSAAVEAGAGSSLTTKGDLETYDTANTRLPVGADGQVLTANSATGTGLEWSAAGTTGIETQDEGGTVDAAATTLNFVGAGVTATDAGSNVTTVTIPGGGASPLTTKGDIFTYDTGDQRLPVGTDGQILSANSATSTGLEWIANTGGGGGSGGTTTGARVSITGNQSISTGTATEINFDTEDFDTEGYHDNVTNNTRLTIPEDGIYVVRGQVRWADNVTGKRTLTIRLNATGNSIALVDDLPTTTNFRQDIGLIYEFSQGDFIELRGIQDSGGNLDVVSGNTHFEIVKVTGGGSGGGGYTETIGDGIATDIVVNHSLGTRDVVVVIYEAASPYAEVETDIEHTDDNNVTLKFAVAPTTNQYNVFVTSGGGGGGSVSNPLTDAGLVDGATYWWRADQQVFSEAGVVSSWKDVLNNAVLRQDTAISRPTLDTNWLGLGLNAISFDGSNDFLKNERLSILDPLSVDVITVFMVIEHDALPGTQVQLRVQSTINVSTPFGFFSEVGVHRFHGRELGGSLVGTTQSASTATKYVLAGQIRANNDVYFDDGTGQVTDTGADNDTINLDKLVVGVDVNESSFPWDGKISDILIYAGTELSTGDITANIAALNTLRS